MKRLILSILVPLSFLAVPQQSFAQTEIAKPGQTVLTGGSGKQILFRDKTSISAGPNTAVAVKRADYDAGAGTGNVVIEVTKGAFRYVTGDTGGSHTIKTPLSTVGVRGTVIEGYVDVRGLEVFVLIEGAFEVCTATMCQQVTEPGTFVVVSPDGTITPPAPLTPGLMKAMLLTVPSVDLLLENFSELVNAGGDPMVRFRDLNEAQDALSPLPPLAPPEEEDDEYVCEVDCSE
jgi:hypothetical protein